MRSIAINRQGALGDVMMILNCVPKLREHYDKIDLYSHKSTLNIIGDFLKNCGLLDGVYDYYKDFNPKSYDSVADCIGYPIFEEQYPNNPMKKHLVEDFAAELNVDVSFDEVSLEPLKPLVSATKEPICKSPYITIQTKTGWSIYKEWWGWQMLVSKLKKERPDISIYQIGGSKDPKLDHIDGSFLGCSFEDNLTAQIWSELHVGLDSVFNHTSNYSWRGIGKKNCVILFGSTQYNASGYSHNTNISLGLPCQPCFRENPEISSQDKGVCPNPPDQTYTDPRHACMVGISVDMVYNEVVERL